MFDYVKSLICFHTRTLRQILIGFGVTLYPAVIHRDFNMDGKRTCLVCLPYVFADLTKSTCVSYGN
jgi:hypothetical protein